jgi:hypothetical protein
MTLRAFPCSEKEGFSARGIAWNKPGADHRVKAPNKRDDFPYLLIDEPVRGHIRAGHAISNGVEDLFVGHVLDVPRTCQLSSTTTCTGRSMTCSAVGYKTLLASPNRTRIFSERISPGHLIQLKRCAMRVGPYQQPHSENNALHRLTHTPLFGTQVQVWAATRRSKPQTELERTSMYTSGTRKHYLH